MWSDKNSCKVNQSIKEILWYGYSTVKGHQLKRKTLKLYIN